VQTDVTEGSDVLAKMRERMIELHGLSSTVESPSGLPFIKSSPSLHTSPQTDNRFVAESAECVEDVGSESPDAEFIRSIGKPDAQKSQDTEVYITLPFGLVRFDNMNKPTTDENRNIMGNVRPYPPAVVEGDGDVLFAESQSAKSAGFDIKLLESRSHLKESAISGSKLPQQKTQVAVPDASARFGSSSAAGQSDLNVFDQQYFGSQLSTETIVKQHDMQTRAPSAAITLEEHNVFDQQYFGSGLSAKKKNKMRWRWKRKHLLTFLKNSTFLQKEAVCHRI
jgi:hypothetical protein